MKKKTYTCYKCWSACNKYNCDNCDKSLEQLADKVSERISKWVFEIKWKKGYITIEDQWRWKAPTITSEQEETIAEKIKWTKESDNKLSYELDRYFIESMAKRMQQNKGKYPPYNRQKPMDIESLKQALLRHTIEVMKGNYTDIDDYDHLSAIACNAQFIYYQLKQCHTTKM